MKPEGGHTSADGTARLHFALPCARLAPYVSTFYFMQVDGFVEDYLHPEWANVRIMERTVMYAGVGREPMRRVPDFIAVGPTSRGTHFTVDGGRIWGIGLLPLGWLHFIAAPAVEYADRISDAAQDPTFADFMPLARALFSGTPEPEAELQRIEAHMLALLDQSADCAPEVAMVLDALIAGEVSHVAELAASAGLTMRSLERLSRKAFGFPPKLLLRRQRFMRSLSRFMLDPSLSWLATLDEHYYDQAQFVRDFRRFMTMTPSQYARMPHPVLMAAAHARKQVAGDAMQTLQRPVPGAR